MSDTNTAREPQFDARMSMRIKSEDEATAVKIGEEIGKDKTFVYREILSYGFEKFSKDPMSLLRYHVRKAKASKRKAKK